jgi:hypothetical protein
MKKLYHVVLLKFASQKSHRFEEISAALEDLRQRMPGFLSLSGGPYSSPEGLNQGFGHGLIMSFADAAARDRYLVDPDHEKIKQAFLPDLENVIAFDFEGD